MILLGLSIILALSIYAVSIYTTTFYDGTTVKNMTPTGNDNATTYIDIPLYVYNSNFTIEVTPIETT